MTRVSVAALAVVVLTSQLASAQQLVPATEPRLVDCNNEACFRLSINAVDASGKPVALELPPGDPSRSIKIEDSDGPYRVFYASTVDGGPAAARDTYWMLLLDMSGSMRFAPAAGKGTRFDAAVEAIRGAISELREGKDHFALVPFESHRVREGVAAAQFVSTRADALQRLLTLKLPPVTNNTALYSATVEALEVLGKYEQQGNDVSLVVFTDGKNDVRPDRGDDRGLLGNEGLDQVRQRARELNIQIKTIGFGVRGDKTFDETALRRMAWPDERQYLYASDAEGVRGILTANAKALASRVNVTFGPVTNSKAKLSARTLSLTISAQSGGTTVRTSSPAIWSAPAIQEPSFTDVLNDAEQKAFDVVVQPGDGPGIADKWIPRGTAFGIFGTLLLLLWFGVPRMVWPESYIPKPNFPMPEARPQGGRASGAPPAYGGAPRGGSGDRAVGRPRSPAPGPSSGSDDASSIISPAAARRPPTRQAGPPPRDPGDVTVYIPRGKKFEKDS